jgi:D-inositol-3-phosphate glycosyltransferase
MKIAIISYWSCPLTKLGVLASGGMNVYVLNFANNLGVLGHKVDIYTRGHKEDDDSILISHRNVRIIHLISNKKNHYDNVNNFSGRVLDFVRKNRLEYDIFHAHYYYSGLAAIKLSQILQKPFIQTFHTLGKMKFFLGGINDPERIKAEKKIINTADGIIASTELEKEDLIKNYQADKNKIFIVPPGVNHILFKPKGKRRSRIRLNLPSRKKLILFVGRIDPIKGLQFLINAIEKLTIVYPGFRNNFRVILIGGDIGSSKFWRNPEVIKINNLIIKADLECCIKFVGSSPHNLLPSYYSASDVVVMPSVYESFGLVVLEAMSCSSVVLASRVGGLKYLIKDHVNGRLFESGNVKELCTELWELLNDSRQRLRLGKNARMISQRFCWDKQARKILEVYGKFI